LAKEAQEKIDEWKALNETFTKAKDAELKQ
jgi:hypothetical protein